MKTFTLYGLRKPGEEVRYIGITCQSLARRLSGHVFKKGSSPHKEAWIAKMFREEKIGPEIVPYCVGLEEQDAKWLERAVIAELRRQKLDLVNLTAGGEGATGYIHSEEALKKMGEAATGRKCSEETRRKMGLASLGRHVGRKRSEETKKGMRLRRHSAETKKIIGLASAGRKPSEGTKKKISAANYLRWEKYRQEKILAEMWGSRV